MLCNPQSNSAYIIASATKNPREVDRATGFISASQMKEMRLREVKGFAQQHVSTKGQSQVYNPSLELTWSVREYCMRKGKRNSLQKITKHSVAEILYLKYVSNMFITQFQSIFLITMAMPPLMNSLKIKLL